MEFKEYSFAANVLILKRAPFEAIAQTLDFTSVTETTDKGLKIVKAGTPIGDGVADNTATVDGILLYDVTEDRPQGTLLKKAYINTAVAQTHSGITISSAVKAALPMVVFE